MFANSAETNSMQIKGDIRFTGAAVVNEVAVLVTEIIAVMVEVLSISLKMHHGEATSSTFVK